jgi:hypothetical protein
LDSDFFAVDFSSDVPLEEPEEPEEEAAAGLRLSLR